MGDCRGDVAEKWRVGCGIPADEVPGLLHDEAVHVGALLQWNFSAVVDDATGVVGVGDRLTFPAIKLVKAVGQRIASAFGVGDAQPPLAESSGGVASGLEEFGQNKVSCPQPNQGILAPIAPDVAVA